MSPVTITDNLQTAVAAYIGGLVTQVQITWSAFTASDSSAVPAGNQIFTVSQWGNFSRSFIPNAGATPTTVYQFAYTVTLPDESAPLLYTEQLTIPNSSSVLTIQDCRTSGVLNGPSGQGSILVPVGSSADNPPPNGNGVVFLSGSALLTPQTIDDGVAQAIAETITVTGATPGSPASIGVYPPLPEGFTASVQITAANTATVTLCNQSGAAAQAPPATYLVMVAR